MATSCVFCRIATKDIPATIVFEDDDLLAFRDLSPQAPTHVLIIPKRHIASLDEADVRDVETLGRMLLAAKSIAAQEGLKKGYRVVTNCGTGAGQSVFHLHLHLFGGRPMSWPPG
jgi:histidine triad (HIT) family protein